MAAHRGILAAAGCCLLLLAPQAAAFRAPAFSPRASASSSSARGRGALQMAGGDAPLNPDHDILLRVARGERAHRTPVWLMRQVSTAAADALADGRVGHILPLLAWRCRAAAPLRI